MSDPVLYTSSMRASAKLLRKLIPAVIVILALNLVTGLLNPAFGANMSAVWKTAFQVGSILFFVLFALHSLAFRTWIGELAHLTMPGNLSRSSHVIQTQLETFRTLLLWIAAFMGIGGLTTLALNDILPIRVEIETGILMLTIGVPLMLFVFSCLRPYLFWITSLSALAQSEMPELNLIRVRQATAEISSWLTVLWMFPLFWLFNSLTESVPGASALRRQPFEWFVIAISVIGVALSLWQTWETRRFALAAEAEANQGRLAAPSQNAQTI